MNTINNEPLMADYGINSEIFKEESKLYRRSQREFWEVNSLNWEQGTILDPVQRAGGARVLSQILHGEQASLLVVGQLLPMVGDMAARYFLATQAADEARHVEAFQRYVAVLGKVEPPNKNMRELANRLLALPDPAEKMVALHILIEGMAQETFHAAANSINDPLLKEVTRRVSLDESRHIAFGTAYLKKLVATMPLERRGQLYELQSELGLLVAGLIVDEAAAIIEFGLDIEQLTTRILRAHYHRLQEIGLTDEYED